MCVGKYSRTALFRKLVNWIANYTASGKYFLTLILLHLFYSWKFTPQLLNRNKNYVLMFYLYLQILCKKGHYRNFSHLKLPILPIVKERLLHNFMSLLKYGARIIYFVLPVIEVFVFWYLILCMITDMETKVACPAHLNFTLHVSSMELNKLRTSDIHYFKSDCLCR
jgi:hypothetical protein